MLNGIKIVECISMVDPHQKLVDRSWKERLFNWPWKPWKTEKLITVYTPSKQVLAIGDAFHMHPSIAQSFRQEIERGYNKS